MRLILKSREYRPFAAGQATPCFLGASALPAHDARRLLLGCAYTTLLLLALSGCESSKHPAQTQPQSSMLLREPRLDLRTYPTTHPAPATPIAPVAQVAQATPHSSGLNIKRPLSQKELDDIYTRGAVLPASSTIAPAPKVVELHILDQAVVVADPRWNVQITREWRHIVVHHSATPNGSMAIFDDAHKKRGWEGVAYHFVIGNGNGSGDGEVEPTYRWLLQEQGAHAGNAEYNQHGIGICLVGNFEHSPPTLRQMDSLRRLVRFLQVKIGIPTYEVIGHGDVPPPHTDCPGRFLDMSAFRASLGGNAIPVPIHYTNNPLASRFEQISHGYAGGAALP